MIHITNSMSEVLFVIILIIAICSTLAVFFGFDISDEDDKTKNKAFVYLRFAKFAFLLIFLLSVIGGLSSYDTYLFGTVNNDADAVNQLYAMFDDVTYFGNDLYLVRMKWLQNIEDVNGIMQTIPPIE